MKKQRTSLATRQSTASTYFTFIHYERYNRNILRLAEAILVNTTHIRQNLYILHRRQLNQHAQLKYKVTNLHIKTYITDIYYFRKGQFLNNFMDMLNPFSNFAV